MKDSIKTAFSANYQKLYKQISIGLGFILATILLSFAVSGLIQFPEQIQVGPLGIRLYSLAIVTAMVTAIFLYDRLRKSEPTLKYLDTWEAAMYVLIPAIVGARIYHVITDYYLYQNNFWGMFAIWNGGLGFIGGLIGGGLGAWAYLNYKKINALDALGILVIVVPIAQAIGRLGNFFNKELFGLPTDLPWALYVDPAKNPIISMRNFSFFHPLFLYEALANIILASLLYTMWKKGVAKSTMVITYITGYGVIRFVLDFLRVDGHNGVWFLSYAQWLVLGWLAFVVIFGFAYQLWYYGAYGKWFTKKK
jgi:phosphatidylglycerol:prolipoprotein diacylglycerol transferase